MMGELVRFTSAGVLPETQRARRGHNFYPPKRERAKVPALYATEAVDCETKTIWCHWFAGPADWWAAEVDWETGRAFGFVQLFQGCGEWGYFDLAELESARPTSTVRSGNGRTVEFSAVIERDCWWRAAPAREVLP